MDTRVLSRVLLIRHTAWPLLAAVLTMAGASIAAAQGAAQPRAELTITFDLAAGTNVLYVQGNALTWHHLAGGFPRDIRINGIAWKPDWNDCVGKLSNESCYSSYFHGAIAAYNPDDDSGTELVLVGSPAACTRSVGGYFGGLRCQAASWGSHQYIEGFFYPRSTPEGASAYHVWLSSPGSAAVRLTYDYTPEDAFFDVVPNNTDNYIGCDQTTGACKAMVGIWNAFALFAPVVDHPDGRLLWPAHDPAPAPGTIRHVLVTMSSDRFGTLTGLMSKSYLTDWDRDRNWDWVVPFMLPQTFTCTPGDSIPVTVDLRFPTSRHLRGTDVLNCPGE